MASAASAKPKKKKEGEDEPKDERVRVVVRIRPPIRQDEKYGEGSEALQVDKERNLLWLLSKEGSKKEAEGTTKQFVFDRVLWKDSEQNDAWLAAGLDVVKATMVGYTGCVMCYGQTGAGKTFTLANERQGEEGIMVQAFNLIFAQAAEDRSLKYEVQLAYVQIYLDGISDLLQPDGVVELREDPKEGVYVSGCQVLRSAHRPRLTLPMCHPASSSAVHPTTSPDPAAVHSGRRWSTPPRRWTPSAEPQATGRRRVPR